MTRPTSRKVRTPWYALVAAPLTLTGTQSLAPALPAIQAELALSDTEIGLFTSVYFLPSILLALPAGMLADRWGRRAVFCGGLTVFGLAGLVMTVFHTSFLFLLVARAIQGAAFAAILPLTMTLIADAREGGDQVKGQSHRSVAMKAGETLGPAAGGALVVVAWYAPLALQTLALPLAAVAWTQVPTGRTTSKSLGQSVSALWGQFRELDFLLLQSVGFFRFFFKFGFLTYLPILAVRADILSLLESGLVLTVSAAAALVTAALMSRVSVKRSPTGLIGVNLFLVGLSLIAIGFADTAMVLTLAAIAFGMADSAVSILYSAVITQAVPDDMRATFVAANGAIRNLGKFAAPVGLGLMAILWPVSTGFVVLGTMAAVFSFTTRRLGKFDEGTTRHHQAASTAPPERDRDIERG